MNVNVNITHRNSPMRINNQDNIFEKKINNKKNVLESPKNKKTNRFLLVICVFETLTLISVCVYSIYDTTKNDIENIPIKYILDDFIMTDNELIIRLLKNQSKNESIKYIQYIMNDRKYLLSNDNFVREFLRKDKTDKTVYSLESNDCDDFSFILYGNFLKYQLNYNFSHSILFGVIYQKEEYINYHHSLNFFINNQYIINCIEPQTDQIEKCRLDNIYRLIF